MKNKIEKGDVPANSKVYEALDTAYFHDAYRFATKYHHRSPLEVWLAHVETIPAWVNFLMATRNKIVSVLGLKNLGHIGDIDKEKPADAYRVGDAVGIFTLLSRNDNEVVLVDSDKHLDVKVSIYKEQAEGEQVIISTVVNVHNLLGKIYMLFVTPMHKVIVPTTIKKAEFR